MLTTYAPVRDSPLSTSKHGFESLPIAQNSVDPIYSQNPSGCHSYEQAVLVQSNIGKVMAYLWVICNEFIDNEQFFRRFIQFGVDHKDHVGVQNILPAIQVKTAYSVNS